jgi:hypothetical protein
MFLIVDMFKWILFVLSILYLVLKSQVIAEGYKSTDAWDIIVVAGQSNSLGWSNEAAVPDSKGDISSYNQNVFNQANDKTPHPRVFILERDPAWPMNATRVQLYENLEPTYVNNCGIYPSVEPMSVHSTSWNVRPSIGFYNTFARRYADANPTKKVLIIHNGFEATGMFAPHNGHAFIRDGLIQWNTGGNLYNTMIRRIRKVLSWNSNNRIVAVLWSQGEADIDANRSGSEYRTGLTSLINGLRTAVGQGNIPFMACGYPKDWHANDPKTALKNQYMTTLQSMSATIYNGEDLLSGPVRPGTVRSGIVRSGTVRTGSGIIPKFGYISTRDVECDTRNNNNNVHYNFAGLRLLGERFWTVFNVIK